MIKILPILLESYELYQITCLLKNYKKINKSEILDKIRAAPYVVRIKIIDDPRLNQYKYKYDFEYTMLKVKYLNVFKTPSKGINIIKNTILNGTAIFHKVEGVIDFKILGNTLHKI